MAETVREQRQRAELRIDVAAELWGPTSGPAFQPAEYNEYGSVIGEGYKVDDSGDPGAARVSHKLPEADLSDPYRLSGDERWAVRLGMLARYAQCLRRGGFEVEHSGVRSGMSEPWLTVKREDDLS